MKILGHLPSNHGTHLYRIASLSNPCPALSQQTNPTSPLLPCSQVITARAATQTRATCAASAAKVTAFCVACGVIYAMSAVWPQDSGVRTAAFTRSNVLMSMSTSGASTPTSGSTSSTYWAELCRWGFEPETQSEYSNDYWCLSTVSL